MKNTVTRVGRIFKVPDLVLLKTIYSFKVYVPQAYYNPLSFDKRGCTYWIELKEEYDIYIQKKDGDWEEEVSAYIYVKYVRK